MAKPKLLIVGAFPPDDSPIIGGIVTTCRILINSDFPNHFDLVLIDSTQKSNPPPRFIIRLISAMERTIRYIFALAIRRPNGVILFTASGSSLLEKGVMAWLARLTCKRVFLFPRGGSLIHDLRFKNWKKKWIELLMKGATDILCQGPAWQNLVINNLGYSEANAPIIYNWSATSNLLTLGADREQNASQLELNILFLGWLEEEKGIFDLLEACRRLNAKYTFRLIVVGKGSAEKKAIEFVLANNMGPYVKFEGWAHNEKKINYLKISDILVLPSWTEGFPNAIIEAMASKLAVVVSAVGNVPDIIEHREQAMVVPPTDCDALVLALEELLVDPVFRFDIANRGYEFAKEKFSSEKGIASLTNIINCAIGSNLGSKP